MWGTQYGYMLGGMLLALGVPMFMRLRSFNDYEDFLRSEAENKGH
jgi:hypothetical protein